ncbi:hypothetical protein LTS08_000356 [Lithohypha guttulata]|uniref:Enoyl-CoA hydratase n=1 Tax=Lithohypha guttulata TaxID=1690604 RepID=A0AAN7T774_9EURO|nr:hypothetical protein LTR51_006721 [Lithohypha guttulata]KAK5089229.1 hypothetical protein LTR05_003455 [Lithohypha guttulata]KAK5106238.1 hypothetical protein LTS08_000356 [Lithohypha guttulata]
MSNKPTSKFPTLEGASATFPASGILLVTINRPAQRNSIPSKLHWQLHALFHWFDNEPSLNVAVITGEGDKSFCAGQDLIELGKRDPSKARDEPWLGIHPSTGFAGISRRLGKKPIIAAVNGFALGGGFEIVLNCDMVVAAPEATFGLPEALRGIYAAAGGLPRLVRNVGMPIASEIAMTGRTLTAQEALQYQLINKVSKSRSSVVDEAIELAKKISNLSPDAVIVTRLALREAWENSSVERAFQLADERLKEKLHSGENAREGLAAFAQKRKPNWTPSKL